MDPHHSLTLAKTLAAGAQDLAALAGFFCTDAVEKNVLATQYGYGVITTSALSILGALGLVKSSVKLALGLEQCRKSGFSLDSLRSIYGYKDEARDLVSCDEVRVSIGAEGVTIKKTRRYFDSTARPILSLGSDIDGVFNTGVNPLRRGLTGKTLINLGNPVRERSLLRHPLAAIVSAIFWSGLTAWPIFFIRVQWSWVLGLATIGLHLSLISMLAVPLWFSYRVDRPARDITSSKFNLLVSGEPATSESTKSMVYTQYKIKGGDGIFFHSPTGAIESWSFKGFALVASALCAVSYVCQYAVLKQASSKHAAFWIVGQAILAFGRVCYWIFKRPNKQEAEFCVFDNGDFEKINVLNLARLLPAGSTHLPVPVWDYLRKTRVRDMLEATYIEPTDESSVGEGELFFLGLDISELVYKLRDLDFGAKMSRAWRLGLYLKKTGTVTDSITVEVIPRLFAENPERGNMFGRELNQVSHAWIMVRGVRPRALRDAEADHAQPPLPVTFGQSWFIRSNGKVGVVPHEDIKLGSLGPERDQTVQKLAVFLDALLGVLDLRQRHTPDYNGTTYVWVCATEGVVLRDGEGWADAEPPYAACLNNGLRRSITSIKTYIDDGHDTKLMYSRTQRIRFLGLSGMKTRSLASVKRVTAFGRPRAVEQEYPLQSKV